MNRNIFLVFLAFFFIHADLFSQKDKIDSLFLKFNNNSPGLALTVLKDGKIIDSRIYGNADLTKKKSFTVNHSVNLSGLSVQVTTIAVCQLMEKGKLGLTDKIGDIIPVLPDYLKNVTVKQLLLQTSGIPNLPMDAEISKGAFNRQGLLTLLNNEKELVFKNEEKLLVNPVNYILLSWIVEAKSGVPFAVYVKNEIFKPLKLKSAIVYSGVGAVKAKLLAKGYYLINGKYIEDTRFKNFQLNGVSGVVCSMNDYLKILEVFEKPGLLLSEKTIKEIFNLNYKYGAVKFYAYGWQIAFNENSRYIFQSGVGLGYTHYVLKMPEENITLVILSNYGDLSGLKIKAFEILNQYSKKKYKVD